MGSGKTHSGILFQALGFSGENPFLNYLFVCFYIALGNITNGDLKWKVARSTETKPSFWSAALCHHWNTNKMNIQRWEDCKERFQDESLLWTAASFMFAIKTWMIFKKYGWDFSFYVKLNMLKSIYFIQE